MAYYVRMIKAEDSSAPAVNDERGRIVGPGKWILEELKWILRVIYSSCDRFYWDNGFSKAAALAYTTLFSLVPVTVFGFGILASVVLANQDLLESVRGFIIRQFVPGSAGADEVLVYLKTFSDQVMMLLRFEEETFRVSVFALVFLVVSCLVLINTIEYTLNQVWQVYEPRTVSHRLSVLCTIIVLTPILAVSAFYTSIFIGKQVSTYAALDSTYTSMVPFLIDGFVFAIVYFLVPKAPVRPRSALFGAFVAAILFDQAKYGFSVYVTQFSSYQRIYGTVSTIVIFLFWLYLSWTIILFGAELSYQFQYLPRKGRLLKRTLMSVGDGRLVLAVQTLIMTGRAFIEGGKLPSELDIAEELGCSSLVLRPILSELKKAEIITRSDSGEGVISLARSPDRISLQELQSLLTRYKGAVHYPAQLGLIFRFLSEGSADGSRTLADILSVQTGNV